jgi:hypothetical protein
VASRSDLRKVDVDFSESASPLQKDRSHRAGETERRTSENRAKKKSQSFTQHDEVPPRFFRSAFARRSDHARHVVDDHDVVIRGRDAMTGDRETLTHAHELVSDLTAS